MLESILQNENLKQELGDDFSKLDQVVSQLKESSARAEQLQEMSISLPIKMANI